MASILVKDASFVITMDEERSVLRDVSIYVSDGIIKALGSTYELKRRFGRPDITINGRGKAVIPGLIDCHTHVVLTALKGLASDLGDVIYNLYWPIERELSPNLAYRLARLGALEAVKGGVTLVNDHYFFANEIANALVSIGIRGLVGHTVMSWDGPWVGEDELRKGIELLKEWRDRSELIIPILAPHSPETVNTSWLTYLSEVAREYNTFIHMHLAQTAREVEIVKKRTGLTPVRLLSKLGVLSERLIAVHCVFIDDEELNMLVSRSVNVVQTPSTYLLDGTPYHAYRILSRGGKVLLGTDAPCYSDGIDMFREMRNLIYSQRLLNKSATILNAKKVLELCTKKAARWLGLNKLGIIKEGFKADLILINLNKPKFKPLHNIINTIVYSTTASDVDTVIINGEVLVMNGKYVRSNEEEIMKEGEEAAKELIRKAISRDPRIKELIVTT